MTWGHENGLVDPWPLDNGAIGGGRMSAEIKDNILYMDVNILLQNTYMYATVHKEQQRKQNKILKFMYSAKNLLVKKKIICIHL